MSTRIFMSIVGRSAVAAACLIASASCGGELLRTGRAPVFLSITQIQAHSGATDEDAGNLLSDVQTIVEQTIDGKTVRVPTIFNDTGAATLRVTRKDPSVVSTGINSVTITRYRVTFRRADGRNTPGVDVPYGFDGGVSATIPVDSEAEVVFDLVRHAAKLEPPLRNMVGSGGQIFISTIAEITFYGRDQNGNEVSVTGMLDVTFGDFGDK